MNSINRNRAAGPTLVLALAAGALLDRTDHLRVLRLSQFLIVGYSTMLALSVRGS